MSSRNNTCSRDHHTQTPQGEQIPDLNVFARDRDGIVRHWAGELIFAPRDEGEEPRHLDSIWPIWNVLDLRPDGRGSGPDFPLSRLQLGQQHLMQPLPHPGLVPVP